MIIAIIAKRLSELWNQLEEPEVSDFFESLFTSGSVYHDGA
jgi:hypothetical protein